MRKERKNIFELTAVALFDDARLPVLVAANVARAGQNLFVPLWSVTRFLESHSVGNASKDFSSLKKSTMTLLEYNE